jgi:hypothetical protein
VQSSRRTGRKTNSDTHFFRLKLICLKQKSAFEGNF